MVLLQMAVPQVCLFIWQKRPIYMAKEAYLYGKKGLLRLAYHGWHGSAADGRSSGMLISIIS
jgi:hypothetical protein